MTLTLEEFADRVDVHFTTASRLKSGERLPSIQTLSRVCEEFEIPLEDAVAAVVYDIEHGTERYARLLRKKVFNSA